MYIVHRNAHDVPADAVEKERMGLRSHGAYSVIGSWRDSAHESRTPIRIAVAEKDEHTRGRHNILYTRVTFYTYTCVGTEGKGRETAAARAYIIQK